VVRQHRRAAATIEMPTRETIEASLKVNVYVLSMSGERSWPGRRGEWEREIMLEWQREHRQGEGRRQVQRVPVNSDAAQIRHLRAELAPAAIAKRLGIPGVRVYRAPG
jgi:hypothetical protein